MAGEILSAYLNTLHNVYFYHWLLSELGAAIREKRGAICFEELAEAVTGKASDRSSSPPDQMLTMPQAQG